MSDEAIRDVLRAFQAGYVRRDVAALDNFMRLFHSAAGLEVIGTGGVAPGDDEWCLDEAAVRTLVENDWRYWGDLRLDIEGARIHQHEHTAWLATSGTVTETIPAEQTYDSFLSYTRNVLDAELGNAEARLLDIVRGGANTLYEARKGERYVWPIRFTAVLVHEGDGWRFRHMQFSFATTRFPDVRRPPDSSHGP